MTTYPSTQTDEPARVPDRMGDFEVPTEAVARAVDADDCDTAEDGYGYGV